MVGDAEAIDQERDAVERRVQEERDRPEGREQQWRDHEADADPGQGRPFEARGGLASQDLVAGRDRGDVPEDGRDARGGRGTLEQARATQEDEIRRQAGQDHRGRAEGRAEEHHAMVSQPIGQQPEHGREDQLRRVERDVQRGKRGRGHDRTAMVGELREVRGAASRPSGRC